MCLSGKVKNTNIKSPLDYTSWISGAAVIHAYSLMILMITITSIDWLLDCLMLEKSMSADIMLSFEFVALRTLKEMMFTIAAGYISVWYFHFVDHSFHRPP